MIANITVLHLVLPKRVLYIPRGVTSIDANQPGSCSCLLIWLQPPVSFVKPLNGSPTIFSQLWLALGCKGAGKESWLPVNITSLTIGCLGPLPLFNLVLCSLRYVPLLVKNGIRNRGPECPGLIRKLRLLGRYDFWDRLERVEIDEESLFLHAVSATATVHEYNTMS